MEPVRSYQAMGARGGRAALVVVLGALLVAAPADSQAQVALEGHVKTFLFQELADPWELDRVGTRLQLAARGHTGESVSYYGAVDFELDSRLLVEDQPLTRGEGLDVFPVEAWVHLTAGPVELREESLLSKEVELSDARFHDVLDGGPLLDSQGKIVGIHNASHIGLHRPSFEDEDPDGDVETPNLDYAIIVPGRSGVRLRVHLRAVPPGRPRIRLPHPRRTQPGRGILHQGPRRRIPLPQG